MSISHLECLSLKMSDRMQNVSERLSEYMSGRMSKYMSDTLPGRISEYVSD